MKKDVDQNYLQSLRNYAQALEFRAQIIRNNIDWAVKDIDFTQQALEIDRKELVLALEAIELNKKTISEYLSMHEDATSE